ncbi:hypothetical protein K474DRAFT_1699813 [Panus rudis PR-1116 ss-1]|nr:hypothetical protein K474DRAFT_1699813 [Panus rudis PR-1116 ss-1]
MRSSVLLAFTLASVAYARPLQTKPDEEVQFNPDLLNRYRGLVARQELERAALVDEAIAHLSRRAPPKGRPGLIIPAINRMRRPGTGGQSPVNTSPGSPHPGSPSTPPAGTPPSGGPNSGGPRIPPIIPPINTRPFGPGGSPAQGTPSSAGGGSAGGDQGGQGGQGGQGSGSGSNVPPGSKQIPGGAGAGYLITVQFADKIFSSSQKQGQQPGLLDKIETYVTQPDVAQKLKSSSITDVVIMSFYATFLQIYEWTTPFQYYCIRLFGEVGSGWSRFGFKPVGGRDIGNTKPSGGGQAKKQVSI